VLPTIPLWPHHYIQCNVRINPLHSTQERVTAVVLPTIPLWPVYARQCNVQMNPVYSTEDLSLVWLQQTDQGGNRLQQTDQGGNRLQQTDQGEQGKQKQDIACLLMESDEDS